MAVRKMVVIEAGFIPDDPEAASVDVHVYVDGVDVIFVVMEDGTGEIRMLADEFLELVKELDVDGRVKSDKKQGDHDEPSE